MPLVEKMTAIGVWTVGENGVNPVTTVDGHNTGLFWI